MSEDVQHLPRFITWGDIQPGDLLRVTSISRYAAGVDDRTGVVEEVTGDEVWTPDAGLLGSRPDVGCIILLGRARDRWVAVRHD